MEVSPHYIYGILGIQAKYDVLINWVRTRSEHEIPNRFAPGKCLQFDRNHQVVE